MIVTIDRRYKVINFNKALFENYKRMGVQMEKGFEIINLLKPEDRPRHIEKYEEAFSGKQVALQEHYVFQDLDQFIVFVFTPITNEKNEITAISIFAKDVTEITKIKNKVEESEKYLKDLMNVSTDPTMTIDREYKLVLFNKHYQDSFTKMGIPIDVGYNIMNIFGNEEIVAEKKQIFSRVFNGEVIEITEHLSSGGLDNYYQTTHAPIYDRHGNINSIAIVAKDITEVTEARNAAQQQNEELKAQEEELRQNMEELSATQELISKQHTEAEKVRKDLEVRETVLGITTILSESDLYGNIIYVNDKLCEVSQFSREELIGQPHSIFRHPDMPKELFKKLWTALKAGKEFRAIIKNRKKDNGHYWVDATLVPVKNEKGKVIKYISARYHIENDNHATELFKAQFNKHDK
jgi:PAS domain S-box-containing protein